MVDISSYSVGQKSGQNASGVDFSTYSVGQISGQKSKIPRNGNFSNYNLWTKNGVKIYSHGQELFYKFVSNFTNKLVKQLLSITV